MTIHVAPGGAAEIVTQIVTQVPSVLTYGADPTGAVDSTSAFSAMAAAHNHIYAPEGTYLISGTFEIAGKTLRGDGIQATKLVKNNASGAMITITPGVGHLGTELYGLAIQHITTTPTSGSTILMSGNGGGARLHDFAIINPYNAFEASATDGGWDDLVALSNFRFYTVNNYGVYVHANPNPVTIRDFAIWLNGNVGCGIILQNQVAAFVAENGELVSGTYNLFTSATSNTHANRPEYLRFTDVFFDSAYGAGGIATPVVALSQAALVKFENCWIAALGGHGGGGCEVTECEDVEFSNTEIADCPNYGCYVASSSKHTRFRGCSFLGNSAAVSNAVDGLFFAAGTTDFVVTDCVATSSSGLSGTFGWGNQRYGINVATGASDRYIIANNLVSGNGTAGVNDGGSGANKSVAANY